MKSLVNAVLGNTPIIKLDTLFNNKNVYAKLEYYNPTFSIKDRAAFNMVKQAWDNGKLKKGDTIIEATSGNTGLGLCFAASVYELHLICTVFSDVPIEKINLLKAFGAIVIICDSKYPSSGEKGYVGVAKRIAEKYENVYYVDQFNNNNNVMAHYYSTGPEIWNQMNADIDYLFATIGTGGTISGIGKYLKEKNPSVKIIGVEPVGGIYKSHFNKEDEHYMDHLIQSISDDFISGNFKQEYVDEVVQVEDQHSFSMCYEAMRKEGIMIGTSSGCVLSAAREYDIPAEKKALCIIPDLGLKYMDTLFNDQYLSENNIIVEDCPKRKQIADDLRDFCFAKDLDCQVC
ncbi:MAG: cysteine synthase family protein [Clostridia bacterium]|nr:cysteine synthase family protein [Clostridia bacterium]